MEWKTDSIGKIFSAYPYRIEKIRNKFKLYRYVKNPIDDRWTMSLLGKFEEFTDAAAAAEADKKQGRLF